MMNLLSKQIGNPITIQFNPVVQQLLEDKQLPFRVVVHFGNNQQGYIRPIASQDGLLIAAMSQMNRTQLAKEIKTHIKAIQYHFQNKVDDQDKQDQIEATCQLLHGTQYIQPILPNNAYVFNQFLQEEQAQINKQKNNQEQFHNNEQNNQLQPVLISDKHKSVLVCAIYDNETYDEMTKTVTSYGSNVNIVIFVNGFVDLHTTLKVKIGNQPVIDELRDSRANKYSLTNAMCLQYELENNSNLIIMIKYHQAKNEELIKWVYEGICTHFDHKYAWVTRLMYNPISTQTIGQLTNLLQNNIIGVSGNIDYLQKPHKFREYTDIGDTLDFRRLSNTFWLNQQQQQYGNKTLNKLFNCELNHDLFFCFYNWEQTSKILSVFNEIVWKAENECSMNNLMQGQNCVFPLVAAGIGQVVKKVNTVICETKFNTNITDNMNSFKKEQNAEVFSFYYFWNNFNIFQQQWNSLNLFLGIMQMLSCGLNIINEYFGVCSLIYIVFISQYQFFISFESQLTDYQFILSFLLPFVIICMIILFILFSMLFDGGYRLVQNQSRSSIIVNGPIYIKSIPNGNKTIYRCVLDTKANVQRNGEQINNVVCKIARLNQQITFTLHHQGQEYRLAVGDHGQKLFDGLINTGNENQDKLFGYELSNGEFKYSHEVNDASYNYENIFCYSSIANFLVIVIFIANIILNYFMNSNQSTLVYIVEISVIAIIVGKIFEMMQIYRVSNNQSIWQVLVAYESHLLYYIPFKLGLQCYSMSQIDRDYENNRVLKYYYYKVQVIGRWMIFNIVMLFVVFMIERHFEYQGPILAGILLYYAIQAVFKILICLGSLCSCKTQAQNPNYQLVANTQQDNYIDVKELVIQEDMRIVEQFNELQTKQLQTKQIQNNYNNNKHRQPETNELQVTNILVKQQQPQQEKRVVQQHSSDMLESKVNIQKNQGDQEYLAMLESNMNLQLNNQLQSEIISQQQQGNRNDSAIEINKTHPQPQPQQNGRN